MRKHTQRFVGFCFHSIATKPGCAVPRPIGHALHGSRRNEVIHFDYRYMSRVEKGNLYTIIVKDDLSGYVWLRVTP